MKFTGRLLIVTHHQNISGPDREEKKNKYNNNNKRYFPAEKREGRILVSSDVESAQVWDRR